MIENRIKFTLYLLLICTLRIYADELPSDTIGQSLYNMAESYYNGENGVFMDREKAFQLYLKAGEEKYLPAIKKIVNIYSNAVVVDNDTTQLVFWVKQGAGLGDADLQNTLGYFYAIGQYLKKDTEQAMYWFRLSAENGDAQAMDNLSKMLDNQGNKTERMKWLRKAAESGYAESQYSMGNMYYYGTDGLKVDKEQAVYWFRLSADQNYANAENMLGICFHYGYGVNVDKKMGFQLYERSYKHGNVAGLDNMGVCYESGDGVEQDLKKAIECYEEGIEKNSNFAKYRLGRLLFNEGGKKEKKRAVILLYEAANSGISGAVTFIEENKIKQK